MAEDVRGLKFGLALGGGIDMLARSECNSVAPGSACLPLRLEIERILEAAEDRECEVVRALGLGCSKFEESRSIKVGFVASGNSDAWGLASLESIDSSFLSVGGSSSVMAASGTGAFFLFVFCFSLLATGDFN